MFLFKNNQSTKTTHVGWILKAETISCFVLPSSLEIASPFVLTRPTMNRGEFRRFEANLYLSRVCSLKELSIRLNERAHAPASEKSSVETLRNEDDNRSCIRISGGHRSRGQLAHLFLLLNNRGEFVRTRPGRLNLSSRGRLAWRTWTDWRSCSILWKICRWRISTRWSSKVSSQWMR